MDAIAIGCVKFHDLCDSVWMSGANEYQRAYSTNPTGFGYLYNRHAIPVRPLHFYIQFFMSYDKDSVDCEELMLAIRTRVCVIRWDSYFEMSRHKL